MNMPGQKPVSLSQVGADVDLLKCKVEAMETVFRALIESHPNPKELVNHWRRVSFDAMETARPKASHPGLPTHSENVYRELKEWSGLIHALEQAG